MNEFVVAPTTLFRREERLLKGGSLNQHRTSAPVLYSNSIENWNLCGETYVRIEIHGGRKGEKNEGKNVGKQWAPDEIRNGSYVSIFSDFLWGFPLCHILVAVFYRMEDTKTVSVRMSDEEVRALSRTRRRRHKVKADREPRANLEMETEKESTQEPVVQKIEPPASVPSIPKGTTTAAVPAVPAKPRIVFTKKNHITKDPVTIAKKLAKKPVLVVGKAAGTVSKVSVPPIAASTADTVSVGSQKKRTRKFKSRRLKMTLHARGSASKQAAKRVAAMSITDVRAQLVAAGLLKGKSRSPPDVLRGMLTEWLQLHAGA